MQVTTIGILLRDRARGKATGSAVAPHTLPATTLVLDSLPGGTHLPGLLTAFTTGIRSLPLRYGVYALLTFVWGIIRIRDAVLPNKPAHLNKMRLDLYNPSVLPKEAKRLYIYSKTDNIILAKDVEEHIAQSRKAGIDVTTEEYDNSPHVSHGRTDATR